MVKMKHTELYGEHAKLGAKMVEFAGWEMPLNYSPGIVAEHLATRKSGGLFDFSHMGKVVIRWKHAISFLQYVLTNNAAALAPGQSQYTLIPNHDGGALDDAYLYRIDERDYLLVINAANLEKDLAWLGEYRPKFPGLVLEDHTARVAMLSLQGPKAKAVLQTVLGGSGRMPPPAKNSVSTVKMFGTKVPVARTGYTGEPLGFELLPSAEIAVALWQSLLEAGRGEGILPIGLGARDTLRLEAGLPVYGHELGSDADGREIPVLALPAARFAVSFAQIKGEFIGREALIKQFQEVKLRQENRLDIPRDRCLVPRTVVPVAVCGESVPEAGCDVYLGEERVGYVTSGNSVPYWRMEGVGAESKPGGESLRRAICLAYLASDLKKGQKTTVVIGDGTVEGVIVDRHLSSEAPPYARPILIKEGEKPAGVESHLPLESLVKSLVMKARDNTVWRQRQTVNLIPSEQTMSPLVRMLTVTDCCGRYAEHRRVRAFGNTEIYYYQGIGFIAEVEAELNRRLKEYLGCSQMETRLVSGQTANTTTFSGLLDYLNRVDRRAEPRRLRSVMNHHIGRGGHLSAQTMGGLRDYVSVDPVTEKWAVVSFPVLADNPYCIDLAKTEQLIERHRPELIILGKSMMLQREPVREIAGMAGGLRPRPIVMYDGAHVLGLFGPYFQQPLQEGADIVTASTHKTFFGTQRGIIASNMNESSDYSDLWKSIVRRAFPGSVSNHHLGTLLGLLMATCEMNVYGCDYQKQVIANAKAFALALRKQGLQVEGDPGVNYTETHQVILRVGYARGVEAARHLEENNIIVNYQGLADDEGFTASSGLRMGVQEMTRFGMKERDFEELAGYVAAVIQGENVSRQVSTFRERFTRMQYCFPEEMAAPLVNDLVDSIVKM